MTMNSPSILLTELKDVQILAASSSPSRFQLRRLELVCSPRRSWRRVLALEQRALPWDPRLAMKCLSTSRDRSQDARCWPAVLRAYGLVDSIKMTQQTMTPALCKVYCCCGCCCCYYYYYYHNQSQIKLNNAPYVVKKLFVGTMKPTNKYQPQLLLTFLFDMMAGNKPQKLDTTQVHDRSRRTDMLTFYH